MRNIHNPMKPYFSFFLAFAFLFASAQKKDTVFRQPDCTKFHQAEKEKFDVLEKDFKKVNFSKLNKLIINHIDKSRLKKQNLKISLIKRKMAICGWDILRYDCISKYNLTNNFYNDIHFWSSETALLLQKKLKKNIVPIISNYSGYSDYHSFYNNQEFFIENPKITNQLKVNKFTFENKDYIYFPYNEEKLEISDSDMIFMYFKNHLNKIIEVEIYYNQEQITQMLKFQYTNHKWKLIETKN